MLIRSAKLILPDGVIRDASILLEGRVMTEIRRGESNFDETTDISVENICAGFIDVHNHGAVGVDVNSASADQLHKVSKFLASNGVTSWLPTLVPDSDENYARAISAIDELISTQEEREPAARILGVHYEGIFANEKMCGALRRQFFKSFKHGNELASLPKLKSPSAIHFTTLAPEVENGIELIKELRRQNWMVAIGHTCADLKTLDQAAEAGAKHLTHFFNAMTPIHHREIGVAGWGLAKDEVTFDIIADGIHVADEMLHLACRAKTAENVSLISDSVAPTGLGDGDFQIWGEKVSVKNGRTQNERGSIAGSVITMREAFL